jgi:hypothetical protein
MNGKKERNNALPSLVFGLLGRQILDLEAFVVLGEEEHNTLGSRTSGLSPLLPLPQKSLL